MWYTIGRRDKVETLNQNNSTTIPQLLQRNLTVYGWQVHNFPTVDNTKNII